MHRLFIILPWAAKEHMANCHWDDITLDGVLIWSNLEGYGHGVLYLDTSIITQPLREVRMGVLAELKIELVAKLGARQVVAASTIHYHLDGLAIYAGSCLEDVASLIFKCLLLSCQDFGDY